MTSNSTGPHDPGEQTEEVEDHPFLELAQRFCTVKKKLKENGLH